jgi:hypothetical protein
MMKIEPFWSFVILTGILLVWVGGLFTLASLGWRRFAAAYRETDTPEGTRFTSHMTSFGRCAHYTRAVIVVPSSRGIHLSTRWPFGMFHSPFLLPWNRVRRSDWPDSRGGGGVTLHIESPEGAITIGLPADSESNIRDHINRAARSTSGGQS